MEPGKSDRPRPLLSLRGRALSPGIPTSLTHRATTCSSDARPDTLHDEVALELREGTQELCFTLRCRRATPRQPSGQEEHLRSFDLVHHRASCRMSSLPGEGPGSGRPDRRGGPGAATGSRGAGLAADAGGWRSERRLDGLEGAVAGGSCAGRASNRRADGPVEEGRGSHRESRGGAGPAWPEVPGACVVLQ